MSKQNKKNRLKLVLAIALPILLLATVATVKWSGGEDATANIPTFEVKRGPLTISIDASGTIKAVKYS